MTMYDEERVVTLLRGIAVPAAPPDRLGQVSRRARAAETRRTSVVAAATALVLLAGVGGAVSLHARSSDQVLTVADAARTTQDAGSARLTVRVAITGSTRPALAAGDLMTLSGPVDFRHQRYALTGTFGHVPFEVRSIGRDEWTRADLTGSFAAIAGAAGLSHKPWTHSIRRASTSLLDSVDPTALLDALTKRGVTLSRTTAGDRRETVLRVPQSILGSVADPANKDAQVTVRSDTGGRIRLLSYEIDAAGVGATRASIAYDDFGVDVHVQPPPADQIQESPGLTSHGMRTQTFTGAVGSSPADRQHACDMLKQFRQNATTPQQKADYEQLLAVARKSCPRS